MAGIRDKDLLPLGPWPGGIDNRHEEHATPDGRVRAADNINLDNTGRPSRRQGFSLEVERDGLHSIWAHPDFPVMLGVFDGDLIAFDASLGTSVVAADVVRPLARMDYDLAAGRVAYCNGTDSGEVDPTLTRRPWAVETPAAMPTVAAHAAGGLTAGTYQVALTFMDASGRESGATPAELIDLTEGQGIAVTAIPQPLDAGVAFVRAYLSPTDGDVLYHAATVPVGITTVYLGVHQPGKPLTTQFLEPLPSGHLVRHVNGRRLVACGTTAKWSQAMNLGLTEPVGNRLSFKHPITLLEPAGEGEVAGVFIAAGERTYFQGGADPQSWRRHIAYPHGAVLGSSLQVPAGDFGGDSQRLLPYWMASNGQAVLGGIGGAVTTLHEDAYIAPTGASSAASVRREYRGVRALLTVLRGGQRDAAAVGDRVSATVSRHGIEIG